MSARCGFCLDEQQHRKQTTVPDGIVQMLVNGNVDGFNQARKVQQDVFGGGCRWRRIVRSYWDDCNLSGVSFRELDLTNFTFRSTNLKDADFTEVQGLTPAQLVGAKYIGTIKTDNYALIAAAIALQNQDILLTLLRMGFNQAMKEAEIHGHAHVEGGAKATHILRRFGV